MWSRIVSFGLALAMTASALLGSLALTIGGATPALASNSVDVFVGYADNLRPSPVNFPTPWQGSPNTIYEGCSPSSSCSFDAGAVMVVNNTGAAVTVNSVVINFSTCQYNIWPTNVALPNGSQLIVTQTTSGSDNGCTPGDGHMDSSDIGPNGAGWAGNCSQSGVIPTVAVTVNGSATTYTDSGQVLNTGGVDQASCNSPGRPAGNESAQWTTIGTTQVCSSAVLTLSPNAQTAYVGDSATITANLTNNCNQPLSGVTVDFNALSGPNLGKTGSNVTDASGNAPLTYSSALTGTDTWQASVTNTAGTFSSNEVTVTWDLDTSAPTCQLTAVGTNSSGQKYIQITVQDSDGGLAGPPNGIVVTSASNATVGISNYNAGTTSPVLVTATKIDQSLGAEVALKITDIGGNVTSCDPVLATLGAKSGAQVFRGLSQGESLVQIHNGAPGLTALVIVANGHLFAVGHLRPDETRTVNVAAAMQAGNANTIVVRGFGPRDGSAELVISDGNTSSSSVHLGASPTSALQAQSLLDWLGGASR